MSALREAVIEQRRRLGWSQQTLASVLGCQQSMVARMETGLRKIDAYDLVLLERALKLEPCTLFHVIAADLPPGTPFAPGWTSGEEEDGGTGT